MTSRAEHARVESRDEVGMMVILCNNKLDVH